MSSSANKKAAAGRTAERTAGKKTARRASLGADTFFMRYAYPCSQNLVMLDLVPKKEYDLFEKMFQEGKPLPRAFVERIFHAAFRRIKEVARDMGIKDHWDIRVLRRYWHEFHNKYIDAGDGNYGRQPKTFCELCKVYTAKIADKKDRVFVVTYTHEGKLQARTVVSDQLPQADIGDTIRIHSGYAIEFA